MSKFEWSQLNAAFFMENFEYIATLVWIVGIVLIRRYVKRALRTNEKLEMDRKRRRLNTADNVFNLVMFVGLILIWATELQNIAISIAALWWL